MAENQYLKLWEEFKKYLRLQIDYTRLSAVEKLSLLVSAATVVMIFALLCACTLFYLSFALACALKQWLQIEWIAYLIVGVLFAILLLMTYLLRKQLIINPVTRYLTRLFLDKK